MPEPSKAFYVTTPIYYVNDAPHIGHAYTTVAGDVLTRWHRQRGEDVWFLTGTDEHGQKVLRAAEANGVDAAGVDRPARRERLAARAGRPSTPPTTTSSGPPSRGTRERVQEFWQRLYDAGDVYEGSYEGPYCVRCEEFKLPAELLDGEDGAEAAARSTAVRSRCSARRTTSSGCRRTPTALLALYEAHPEFVQPRERAQRGRLVRPAGPAGPLDLAVDVRLGHPGPVGRLARPLRLDRRAAQLRHGGRLRRRRTPARAVRPALAGRRPPGRQGHPALPRRDLAGDADGRRACRCRARCSPTAGCSSAARR